MSTKLSPTMQKSIKAQVEKMSCPVHHKHPKVTFTSKGYSVSDCCCEDFKDKVVSATEAILSNAVEAEFKNMLRGFKNLKVK